MKVRGGAQSTKFSLQVKEIKIKVILYNLSKLISALSALLLLGNSTEPKIYLFKTYVGHEAEVKCRSLVNIDIITN